MMRQLGAALLTGALLLLPKPSGAEEDSLERQLDAAPISYSIAAPKKPEFLETFEDELHQGLENAFNTPDPTEACGASLLYMTTKNLIRRRVPDSPLVQGYRPSCNLGKMGGDEAGDAFVETISKLYFIGVEERIEDLLNTGLGRLGNWLGIKQNPRTGESSEEKKWYSSLSVHFSSDGLEPEWSLSRGNHSGSLRFGTEDWSRAGQAAINYRIELPCQQNGSHSLSTTATYNFGSETIPGNFSAGTVYTLRLNH